MLFEKKKRGIDKEIEKKRVRKSDSKRKKDKEIRTGRSGHWTVNHNGTQSFITTLSFSKATKALGTFIDS